MGLKRIHAIVLLLIFFGVTPISYSQSGIPITNECKELDLKGPVKSLYEYWEEALEKEEVIEVWDKTRYGYWKFDKNGRIIDCSIQRGSELIVRNEYQYNETGYRTQIIDWKKDTIYSRSTYAYDFENAQVEEVVYETKPSMNFKSVHTYFNGLIKTSIHYTFKGGIDARYEFEYDENGNIAQEKVFEGNGELISYATYTYDKNGNRITESFFDAKGVPESSRKYTYEYDKKGNWIKRIKYLKEKPVYVFERKIEYY